MKIIIGAVGVALFTLAIIYGLALIATINESVPQ